LALQPRVIDLVGFSGRDRRSVESHLDELEALGVERPAEVPAVWQVPGSRLVPPGDVEIATLTTSGEVEPVVLRHGGEWFVSVGSDHTDREAERTSILDAKQRCPKVLAAGCWRIDDVFDRWDGLTIHSFVQVGGAWRPYQEASLRELVPLSWFLDRFGDEAGGDRVVFCGTVPTVGGLELGASAFRGELVDHTRRACLRFDYRTVVADRELPATGTG
jgi:hypothetical protein